MYTKPQNHDIITKYKPHDDLWKNLIQLQLNNNEFENHPDVAWFRVHYDQSDSILKILALPEYMVWLDV